VEVARASRHAVDLGHRKGVALWKILKAALELLALFIRAGLLFFEELGDV
jgi:hypothetical protein